MTGTRSTSCFPSQQNNSLSTPPPGPLPSPHIPTFTTLNSGGPRPRLPRRPTPANCYTNSPYRPHCLASDRLFLWTSPASSAYRAHLITELGLADARALLQVQIFSLDEKTRENYAAGLLRFTQYCDSRQIPEDLRMPASEILLCGFATVCGAGRVARSTIDSWLAGLHFWHTLNGAPWLASNSLRLTKGGISKLVPDSARRDKRPPVTIEHMHALRAGLNISDPFDAAVFALACVAFWSCCRLGELLIPSANGYSPNKHASRGTPTSFRTGAGGTQSASFHIPWTKTTRELGADIIVTANNDPSCPLAALVNHLSVNDSIPSSAPLFSFHTATGCAPLTRTWFLERCESVWTSAGLSMLQGHAFRIGGATELLLRGTHPDVVAVQGRWKSRAFLEYWRRIEGILPLFITNSFHADRARLTSRTMADFARRHRPPSSTTVS